MIDGTIILVILEAPTVLQYVALLSTLTMVVIAVYQVFNMQYMAHDCPRLRSSLLMDPRPCGSGYLGQVCKCNGETNRANEDAKLCGLGILKPFPPEPKVQATTLWRP